LAAALIESESLDAVEIDAILESDSGGAGSVQQGETS
jgi:hypothetical protein